MNNNNLEILDLLSVISFVAQMKNIKGDEQSQQRAKMMMNVIAQEIKQFHDTQNAILNELKEIKKLLQERR